MSSPNYPPPPWPPTQQPPPAKPGRNFKWPVLAFIGGLLLGAGIGAAGAGTSSTTADASASQATRAAPATVVVTRTRTVLVPTPVPAPPPPPPPGPKTTFGNGIWEVGVDVQPGKYKTDGGTRGSCYYALLSGTGGGGTDDIIDNNIVDGPATVTISGAKYFESNRCGTWTLAG